MGAVVEIPADCYDGMYGSLNDWNETEDALDEERNPEYLYPDGLADLNRSGRNWGESPFATIDQ